MEKINTSLNDSQQIPSAIIIIGSGPAGCAAAITCANAGLNTVLITKKTGDQKRRNREQPLESVHPGVSSLLEKLNAAEVLMAASRASYEGIQTGENFLPLGADENGNWQGHHVNRDVLDAQLLNCAAKQGVLIMGNEAVKDLIIENNWVTGVKTSSGKIIQSAYVIDASGYARFAGKTLKFKEKFFSPSFVSWTGFSKSIEEDHPIFSKPAANFIPGSDGWTWLAPEPPSRCTWTRLAEKGKHDLQAPHELMNYPLAGKIKAANMRWRLFRPLCKEGLLLCGDAAGILDPAAGQGILNALWSGIMAAQTVISCLQQPDKENLFLAQYDDWFLQQYEKKVKQLRDYYIQHGILTEYISSGDIPSTHG